MEGKEDGGAERGSGGGEGGEGRAWEVGVFYGEMDYGKCKKNTLFSIISRMEFGAGTGGGVPV